MMIRFNCSSCGTAMFAPQGMADRTTKCLKCKHPISVSQPTPRREAQEYRLYKHICDSFGIPQLTAAGRMTESEWLSSMAPTQMIRALWQLAGVGTGKESEHSFETGNPLESARKHRLFACSFCRQIWRLLNDVRSQRAVEVAEEFADGNATKEELNAAHVGAMEAARILGAGYEETIRDMRDPKSCEDWDLIDWDQAEDHAYLLWDAAKKAALVCDDAWYGALDPEPSGSFIESEAKVRQEALLRDVFGNPWRKYEWTDVHDCEPSSDKLQVLDRRWRAWNDGIVVRLAQAAYDGRILPAATLDNTRLLILADALEKAGCQNKDILTHCRAPADHVRGCWVVDLLLEKT